MDAHVHLWDPAMPEYPWLTPALGRLYRRFDAGDLRRTALPAGAGAVVVVQAAETVSETRELLALAEREPLIAGVVGWVDVEGHDVAAVVRDLRAGQGGAWLAGVRVNALVRDPGWLGSRPVTRSLRAVAGAGPVIELLADVERLPAVAGLAERLEAATIVVDHLALPAADAAGLKAWERACRSLAAHPGVQLKLSGIATLPSRVTVGKALGCALEHLGPRRILFGSDWPVCLQAAEYGEVLERSAGLIAAAGADEEACMDIWRETAARVYGLSAADGAQRDPKALPA